MFLLLILTVISASLITYIYIYNFCYDARHIVMVLFATLKIRVYAFRIII